MTEVLNICSFFVNFSMDQNFILIHRAMKSLSIIFSLTITLLIAGTAFSQVSVTADGSAPDNSAMLDVKSTTRGLLIPRMTNTDMNGIISPVAGLMLYNTTDNNFYYYTGTSWKFIVGNYDSDWVVSSNNLYSGVSGNVGIGIASPTRKLHVYDGGAKIESNSGQTYVELSAGSVIANESSGGTSRFVTSIGNTWTWGIGKTNSYSDNFQLVYYPNGRYDITVLTSNGNVGINNTGPSQKLDVYGNMKLYGAFYDTGNDPGTNGQVLSSTVTGTDWITPSTLMEMMDQSPVAFSRSIAGRIEDFGSGSVTGGTATVILSDMFSGYADLNQPYHVFLTPMSESPIQLTVAEKNPTGFSIRAFDKDGNPASCEFDYRVVARMKK